MFDGFQRHDDRLGLGVTLGHDFWQGWNRHDKAAVWLWLENDSVRLIMYFRARLDSLS